MKGIFLIIIPLCSVHKLSRLLFIEEYTIEGITLLYVVDATVLHLFVNHVNCSRRNFIE